MRAKISAKQGEKARKAAVRQGAGGARTGKIEKSRQNTSAKKRGKATKGAEQLSTNASKRSRDSSKGVGRDSSVSGETSRQRGKGEIGGGQPFPPTTPANAANAANAANLPHQCLTSASPRLRPNSLTFSSSHTMQRRNRLIISAIQI